MTKFRKYLVAVFATLLSVAASAADVPYGKNLLQNTNPDGTTFAPWVKTDDGSGWAISDGKFCSSYLECVLTQTLNLKELGLVTGQTDGIAMLAMVNYEILWPGNNKCIAKVIITCKDSDGNNLSVQSLLDINQSNIEVSATLATKSFLLPKGTTQLVYEMHGKDQVCWDGRYGPRFWGMYIGFADLTKTYTASAVAALGDSLVLSKTDGIKILDTVTVTSKYSDVRVKSISSENYSVISSTQAMCIGSDMTINAEFYRKHSIVFSSEYGTIAIKKDVALYGDTITVSHTINSDTVRFVGDTTTPDLNWLNDSTFIMVDEDVTIGMKAYRKHSVVASASEYGTITVKKDAAFYGDTITVSYTMNSDTVRFAGYTTTPGINWLSDSTFIMTDENVTIGMEVYNKHSIVASSSEYGTITIQKDSAFYGDTVTVSHSMNSSFAFVRYTSTSNLTWLTPSTFIMPDENITIDMEVLKVNGIPFRDGFENGNMQGSNIADGWWSSGNSWTANNTGIIGNHYIEPPYSGSWSVTLYAPEYYRNSDCLFTPVNLEKGEMYVFSMYVSQYRSSHVANNSASISVKVGTAANEDSMKQVLLDTEVADVNDYQHMLSTFVADTSGVCWLGIRGYLDLYAYFLSIDNISLVKAEPHRITAESEYGTMNVEPNKALCGDTIAVSHTIKNDLIFLGYTTTSDVTWVNDSTFIMPDEDVTIDMEVLKIKNIPFFDGFENGNTQGSKITDWLQRDGSWRVNSTETSYDRTPYSGSWNATLPAGSYGNNDWLFTPMNMEKGKKYVLSIYARKDKESDGSAYYNTNAYISAKIGTAPNEDSMKQEVLLSTAVTSGDYQHIVSSFTADTGGVYWLGINGGMGEIPYFLSIDNVSLAQEGWHTVVVESKFGACDVKQWSFKDDIVNINRTMKSGYAFTGYTTTPEVKWTSSDFSSFIMPDEDVIITMNAEKIDYSISVGGTEENGSVATNVNTAQVDDIVKLTITSAVGYTIDTILISQNGNVIAFNADDSTFIMPAGNVEISPKFKKIDYNITVSEAKNGSVKTDTAAQMNDMVELAITPDPGYDVDEITIYNGNKKVTFNEKYNIFVMPAGDVQISATFKKADYSITIGESENGSVTSNKAIAQMDDTVKLSIEPNPNFVLDKVVITQDETEIDFNVEDSIFIMPTGDVTISATFTKVDYTILVHKSENGTVKTNATAQMDDVVKLAITPAIGYTLDEITITQNGDMVTFNAEDSTFVMPADSVEISATFKKIDYNITMSDSENGSVASNKATAQIGDTVKLTITSDLNFDLVKVAITQGESQVNFNDKDSTFIMPAADVTISVTFKQSTDVEDVKVLNLYVADGRIYCEGEFRIYDLLGRDVTAMNGSLRGVYVVRTKDAFQKTIVK